MKKILVRTHLKKQARRKRQFVPWDQVQQVALIIENQSGFNKSVLDKFIIDTGKRFDVLFIDTNNKESVIKDYITFCKSDKNLLNLPSSKGLEKIAKRKADVIIICVDKELEYAAVLAANYEARCYCGYSPVKANLDIIIERKTGTALPQYLEEVLRYLKMIRNS